MGRHRFTGLCFISLSLAACSSEDGGNAKGEKLCKELESHADDCGLVFDGECNSSGGDETLCALECATKASCDELRDLNAPGTALSTCRWACQGVTADKYFICADGEKAVDKAGVCNRDFDCLDGSDEADCGGAASDGGVPAQDGG